MGAAKNMDGDFLFLPSRTAIKGTSDQMGGTMTASPWNALLRRSNAWLAIKFFAPMLPSRMDAILTKSGEIIKNPACPDWFLRYLKNERNSFNASLFNNLVLLWATLNCRSAKETKRGSSAKRVIWNLLDSTHRFSDSWVVCKTICRALPTSAWIFSLTLSRANQARATTRIMKQLAKIIKMFNFWVEPRSEESRSLLARFKRRSKKTSRPPIIIAATIIESKNMKLVSLCTNVSAQAFGRIIKNIVRVMKPPIHRGMLYLFHNVFRN